MTRRPLLLVKAIHFSDPVGEEDLVQNELEFLASPHSRVKESDLALGRSCPADGEAASRVKLLVSRIIYTRFHTKSSVLLRRIKNKNIEAKTQKLIVETLGPLQGKHEVFKDGAIKWRLPLLKSMELEMYV